MQDDVPYDLLNMVKETKKQQANYRTPKLAFVTSSEKALLKNDPLIRPKFKIQDDHKQFIDRNSLLQPYSASTLVSQR